MYLVRIAQCGHQPVNQIIFMFIVMEISRNIYSTFLLLKVYFGKMKRDSHLKIETSFFYRQSYYRYIQPKIQSKSTKFLGEHNLCVHTLLQLKIQSSIDFKTK